MSLVPELRQADSMSSIYPEMHHALPTVFLHLWPNPKSPAETLDNLAYQF